MTTATETKVQPLGDAALALVEKQGWLDVVGDRLQEAVRGAYRAGGERGRRVRDFLHGVWLGHPLHSPLTHVALGAWTTALVLDASSGRNGGGLARAADMAVGIGIGGAVGAAATGLTDWQHTAGGDRRVGVGHALLNTVGLALYVTSLVLRGRGMRGAGRGLAALGFIATNGAAYLGGTLVFKRGIGVDHAPRPEAWDDFVPVLSESDLAEGAMRAVDARGVRIALVRRGGHVHALADSCAHLGGPLSEGCLDGDAVRCPWHGSLFALEDGRVLAGPSTFAQTCFDVRCRDGRIEVRARG